MCIVSAFPKGTEKNNEYTRNFIKNGFNCNKDGSGYMYKRNGETTITVNKGFFNITELLDAITKEDLQIEDELVVHHRISTAGKVSKENCHPFVVSKNHSETAALTIKTEKPCLTHNGHFSNLSKLQDLDRDFSDTYAFTRYIFTNKEIQRMFFEKDDLFKLLTDNIIGFSKIAVLSSDRDMILYGNFTEDKGYYHSNTGYCDRKQYNYGNYYGHGSFHEEDEDSGELFPITHRGRNAKDWSEGHSRNNSVPTTPLLLPLSTIRFLKLDNDVIKITNLNSHHFKFIRKGAINLGDISNIEYGEVNNFDKDAATNTMCFVKDGVHGESYEAIRTDYILSNYYYYPKPTYLTMYLEYKELIQDIKDAGKQTLKKLVYLLSKNVYSENTHLIRYPKNNKRYQKGSLLLFKDLLEREIAFKNENKAKVIPLKLSNLLAEPAKSDEPIEVDDKHQAFLEGLGINM